MRLAQQAATTANITGQTIQSQSMGHCGYDGEDDVEHDTTHDAAVAYDMLATGEGAFLEE